MGTVSSPGLHASNSEQQLDQVDHYQGGAGQASSSFGRQQADEVFLSSASNGNGNHIRDQASSTQQQPATPKLRIVRLLAPDGVQNGTQNVTIGELGRRFRLRRLSSCAKQLTGRLPRADCMFKFDKKLDQRLTIKW